MSSYQLTKILAALALTLPLAGAMAGTYTCDFTAGLDTSRWDLGTSYPYDCYSNSIDSRGITFQRVSDPPSPASPNQNFGSYLNLRTGKLVSDSGAGIVGDFTMQFTYSNLNHFTASYTYYGGWDVNQVKGWALWGDGGAQRRILIGRTSSALEYWFVQNYDFFRGYQNDDNSAGPDAYSITDVLAFGDSATLKMVRTNGFISYFVNDQLLGTDAPGPYTTNNIGAVTLQLLQGNSPEHLGVTFTSFSISGPSVTNAAWPERIAPVITSASSATGQVAQSFSYQITASNNPTRFGATGLPVGLTVNPNNGIISGIPVAAGSFSAQILAANPGGTNTAPLNLTFLAPLVGPWPTNSLPAGIAAWWPGDGHCQDVVGTNHGTAVGGGGFTTGRVGPAFSLNGVNQYVRIANSPDLNPAASFSVDAWVFPTQTANQMVLGKWGDSGDYDYQRSYALMLTTDNAAQFAISDAAHQADGAFHVFNSPANAVPLNAWTHVAGVYDHVTGTRCLYINGVLRAARTDPPITVLNGVAAAALGAYLRSSALPAAFFMGQIDEVAFCQRAYSSNEVAAIYAAGSAGRALPPVLTATPNAGGVQLSWSALYGIYGLLARPDLAADNWETVPNAPTITGTRKEVWLPANAPVQRFFRLRCDN